MRLRSMWASATTASTIVSRSRASGSVMVESPSSSWRAGGAPSQGGPIVPNRSASWRQDFARACASANNFQAAAPSTTLTSSVCATSLRIRTRYRRQCQGSFMCGIVGYIDKREHRRVPVGSIMLRMLSALGRRGPDSAGVAIFGDDPHGVVVRVKLGESGDLGSRAKAVREAASARLAVRAADLQGHYLRLLV